ncbi:MAG: DPP IV N-terminal domain-containing protein, partial [Acidobacteria bacterium]|nr:DPP IV N-terminal domain-containing protein [Acidobacteriota bacterium]
MPSVSSDGKFAVAVARSADNKDRWFVSVDPDTGKTKVIDVQHDDAWIREAGFGGSGVEVLPDNRRVWFLSERDGWMHLYTLDVAADGARPNQLMTGKWEITAAELARDERKFYITSTEVHPGERHLYTLPIDGGPRTKVTLMSGSNEATVSPDESVLGLVYSYTNKPPELYLMPNQPGAAAKQITTTPIEEWRGFNW